MSFRKLMVFEKDKSELTFELGKDYPYLVLEHYAHENGIDVIEHGPDVIGQNLIVIEEGYKTTSFIMTGYQQQAIYTCVYKN
jgi:hypothetical protein